MNTSDGQSYPEVPGFEVVREIGRGGSGVVFEAQQLSIDRSVALKVISVQNVGSDAKRRFRAECRAVGGLSWNPHVVSLYDAGITPHGAPFLAMELLPGGSLGDQIGEGRTLGATRVAEVGVALADALTAAHAAGVLHRDIKPDNLLVGRRGEVQLGDFGIATLTDATRTAAGSFAGTLAYMAPELLHGARATERSDLFACGVTLYALLSGRPAFVTGGDDTPASIMWRVISEPVPQLPDSVPASLRALIEGAMAKDPDLRPATAEEMGDGLRDALAAMSTTAGTRNTSESPRNASPAPESHENTPAGSNADTVYRTPRTAAEPVRSNDHATKKSTDAPPRRKKRAARIVLALIGVAVFGALAAALALLYGSSRGTDPAATVNGHKLTRSMVRRIADAHIAYAKAVKASSEGNDSQIDKQLAQLRRQPTAAGAEAISSIIQREITAGALREAGGHVTAAERSSVRAQIKQQIRMEGITKTTSFQALVDIEVDQAATAAALQRVIAAKEPAGQRNADLLKAYASQRDKLTQVCVEAVVLTNKAAAESAARRLRAGDPYPDVAAESLQPLTGDPAQDVPCLPRDNSIFDKAFRTAKPGDILGPAQGQTQSQSPAQWLVVKVKEVKVPTFAQFEDEWSDSVPDRSESATQKVLDKAYRHAKVTVDPRYGTWRPGQHVVVPPPVPGATTTTVSPTSTSGG